MAQSNVIPMKQRRSKVAFKTAAKIAQPEPGQRLLDMQIGLMLLGTEGREQFCQYLQVRHAQSNWGQATTQAA